MKRVLFFPLSPSFVTTDIRRTYPLPRPRDAWHRISGITLRKIVDVVNRTMFVIPANEGSIETAVHTHTHMYTHECTHGERRVTGSRASSTLYINSHRPGKPPIGVRTVKLLPDNGPRSHLRETEIWICFALPASTPRKCSINKQFWREFDSCVRIILLRQYFIAKFRHLCLLVEDRYICVYIYI